MRNKKGFTLMELVIVLAILAIIAAILIPTFMRTTDRARLRSDIQSAQVIHNAMELYRAERGRTVESGITGSTVTMDAILDALYRAGYLSEMEANDTQTANAVFVIYDGRVRVDISNASADVRAMENDLSQHERNFIRNTNPTP